MFNSSISLETLLETHELPFVIIDSTLTVVGLNSAWEKQFSTTKKEFIGKSCCDDAPNCRHHELFQHLEAYEVIEKLDQQTLAKVKGYPLLDKSGQVYLGESVSQIMPLSKTVTNSKMVGSSETFKHYFAKLQRAAKSNVPVFFLGETGTGKELAAEFIHSHSSRADHEFVVVDCTVLSEDLFESELFGHEKGSFSGAIGSKKGLFEVADQGTIFLDEVGELPISQQPKLLRVLETGQFRRVGSTKSISVDVRVVCATHRNLADMVKQGMFREDLYYRLTVFPVQIPPLRDRMQDIMELTDFILHQIGSREACAYSISKAALKKLLKHNWPGNIRELKNCLQLACSLCENNIVNEDDITYMQHEHLPFTSTISGVMPNAGVGRPEHKEDSNPLVQMEIEVIRGLLEKYNGNRKLIAEEMNVSERTLYRKLKRFNLK